MKTNIKSVTSPVNARGTDRQVVISPRISSGFFRLMHPREITVLPFSKTIKQTSHI
jgi:hypothetical protein